MRIELMRGMLLVGWLLVLSRRKVITESGKIWGGGEEGGEKKKVGRNLEDQDDG